MSAQPGTPRIVKLPVKPVESPEFAAIARRIEPPRRDLTKPSEFFAAWASFAIGQGPTVDVSFLYSNHPRVPRAASFDRHLHSEELWVPLEGAFYLPAGPCASTDPDEVPPVERMHCFLIRVGDFFALKPNVWHGGVWPVVPGATVRFMMILSGHRKTAVGRALDNPVRRVPDTQILPDAPDLVDVPAIEPRPRLESET